MIAIDYALTNNTFYSLLRLCDDASLAMKAMKCVRRISNPYLPGYFKSWLSKQNFV